MMVMGIGDASSALPIPARLVQAFIEHRHRDLATLRGCMKEGDHETIARIGHTMRGSSPSYGFPELAQLGERLEAAALARNMEEMARETNELAAWLTRAGYAAQRSSESGTHLRAQAAGTAGESPGGSRHR